MKKLLISLFVIIGVIGSYARDFYLDNMTSANTSAIVRYGDLETSLFTGRLDFSIPIYSLEDPDFHLDIALNYISDGFKPCKSSGYVGYNWSLQAGGCITREVRNYPDEICRLYNTGGNMLEGMYHFTLYNTIDKNDVFAQNSNAITNCNGAGSNYSFAGYNVGTDCFKSVDYLPDIYHFNFCGYHGTFIINNSGEAIILNGDYVSVDISNTIDELSDLILNTRPVPVETSRIDIKTNDGYTYIFGGTLSALEYSVALQSGQQEVQQAPPIINSWYLSKIIAPNGRTINFYYAGRNEGMLLSDNLFVFSQYYDLFATPENPFDPSVDYHLKYNYIKECVLDSVSVSGQQPFKIRFCKSLAQKQYKHAFYNKCNPNYRLDSILFLSSDQIISSAHLMYEYKTRMINSSEGFYWRFLSNVTLSGKGTYSLLYNHELTYPNLYMNTNSMYTDLIDLYGYWKATSLQGLLSEVTYPTGGKQCFTFEPHKYGIERRYRKINSNKDVELQSVSAVGNPTIGGARIQQIKTYIGEELVEKKIFQYHTEGTSNSSGVFYNNLQIYPESGNGNILLIQNGNNYSLLDTHIGYSYVEEHVYYEQNTKHHKTSYSFSTGMESFSTMGNPTINKLILDAVPNIYGIISGILTFDKILNAKGKMLAEKSYENDALLRTVLRVYNGVPLPINELIPAGLERLGCIDTLIIYSNYGNYPISRKLFIYPDILEQEVICNYNGATNPLMINRNFLHDKKFRLIYETIVDSKLSTHFTKYTYPDNLHFNVSNLPLNHRPALYLLQQRNQINKPIETVSGYIEGGNEYVTAGSINLYANGEYGVIVGTMPSLNGDTMYIGETRYYPYLYQTLTLPLSAPIGDYQPIGSSGNNVTYDSYYQLNTEYFSDKMGRLLSVKPFGGIETKYTWNGIYPVTKTIGNQTWTYTYIPHVGISSVTDPRGITTYYTYDSAGRLIEEYQIVNGNKQILSAYQYHIKTE